jgi:hypothetical protein
MKLKKGFYILLVASLFLLGLILTVWDLYETILTAGDTPYRLHHGWIGISILVFTFYGYLAWKERKWIVDTIRRNLNQ